MEKKMNQSLEIRIDFEDKYWFLKKEWLFNYFFAFLLFFQHAVKELLDFFELPRVSVELLKQKAKQKLKLLAAAGKEKIEAAFAKHKVSILGL